jgi:hypothetical protein
MDSRFRGNDSFINTREIDSNPFYVGAGINRFFNVIHPILSFPRKRESIKRI